MTEQTDDNDFTGNQDSPRRARSAGRRGGRASAPRQFDTSVPSPCVSVCQFNGEPFCRGCYRNIDEIREWMIMTREQKLSVVDAIAQRRIDDTGEQLW